MAEAGVSSETVRIQCPCGGEVEFEVELLGRIIHCPHCERYLRPALQFFLADKSVAANIAAQCTCGHFIVESPDMVGKRSRCKVCRRQLILPQPVVKFNVEPFVRVPRRVLQGQLRRDGSRRDPHIDIGRLKSAGQAGRITLGPGQRICVNANCGALLPLRAIVCPKCGTNRLSGKRYQGPGPAGDPIGKWRPL